MIKSTSLLRVAVPLAVVLCGGTLVPGSAAAFTPISGSAGGENTPLKLSSPSTTTSSSGGGGSVTRTIVALAIVIAVIWGLAWALRRVKGGGAGGRVLRSAGTGLESVAALTLASGRSLHLVRAGHDYLLVGSSEHGVVPIHRYSEQQALQAGLIAPTVSSQQGVLPSPVAPSAPATGPGYGPGGGYDSAPARGYAFGPGSGTLVERLREWTVRR
ncbi:MAG TPA: flagellar biosynthetic protein FliO [Solirubrobacteraceae bacterium]|nr:flagellar biosynthetic protein FliO [Solirubrobacteraceae bacterium]